MTSTAEMLARGWELQQAGHLSAAEMLYRQALQAAPSDPNAWCYLGMVCHDQDRFDEAVAAYRQAIRLQPNFPIAFNNLGNTFRVQGRLAESLASFDQALALQPDYLTAHKNKGTALVWEGRLEEALACYQQALELAPDDAETHKNLGVIWLLQGRFEQGWPAYQWRWQTNEISLPDYPQPLWDGAALDGRTILLTAEQGLGDAIQFIRYAAVLKRRYDGRVIAACPPSLTTLLRSCPGIDVLVAQGDPLPPFDVFAPLLNVPGILHDNAATFPADVPYLHADQERIEKWHAELAPYRGARIGIAWQGNRQNQTDRMRSMPLAAFLPLAKLQGLQLFSLQKGPGAEQVEALHGRLPLVALGSRLDETGGAFLDTAAVLKNLDLLITSDTAIAHLAGALGVPVWLALAHVPDWRWLQERPDTPWYPTMRLFRQPRPGDWAAVFRDIAQAVLQQYPTVTRKQWPDYCLASSGMNRLTAGRHGLFLYNRFDRYIGRSLERYGEFSEGEADVFRQLVRPGNVVVEAGANLGAHTLVLSELVGDSGWVYAFEPQRVLFQTLCGNLALNSRTNVVCRCEAVGASLGTLRVPTLNYRAENNFGGLTLGGVPDGEPAAVITVDSLQLPRCDLLKADVEGMELDVLKGAAETIARHRPILYVENDRRENSADLIEYLQSRGYNLYWHLPPLFSPANFFENSANEFAGIVSANMLGIHASVKAAITGLPQIASPQETWQSRLSGTK